MLSGIKTVEEPVFGLHIPTVCPGVPPEILDPRRTWKDGDAYDHAATELAARFKKNFERFDQAVPQEIRIAGPI